MILFLTRGVPEAPAPWRTRKEGRIWELPREADVRAPAEPARVGTGLVTLGRDERGTDVLIDLSMVDGDVAVGGAPLLAAEIVSALALELCTNPWSARVRVTGVGLPPRPALPVRGPPGGRPGHRRRSRRQRRSGCGGRG